MFYRFGTYFETGMALATLILVAFSIKLRRLEYRYQTDIFRILGWPGNKIKKWIILDYSLVLFVSALLAVVFILILWWQMPFIVKIGPVINYDPSL